MANTFTQIHIHILFGMRPTQSLSDLMQDIKGDSSRWINENKFVEGKFSWQEGYGGFSYCRSQLSLVAEYIENQEHHHKKKRLSRNTNSILKNFNIEFDERYIFKPVE